MPLAITDFTTESLDGTGVFDVMMRGAKAHVVEEYNQNRIKGAEYANVYLSLLDKVMDKALAFLLEKDKTDLELLLIQAQIDKIAAEILKTEAEVLLVNAQKCVAEAQFDKIMAEIPKVAAEVALLTQKTVTETAQTSSVPIDANSVIGKQISIYTNQAAGYLRDAEQKATKMLIDTWNVRRTTDEATLADAVNKLDNNYIGSAVTSLLVGAGIAVP